MGNGQPLTEGSIWQGSSFRALPLLGVVMTGRLAGRVLPAECRAKQQMLGVRAGKSAHGWC